MLRLLALSLFLLSAAVPAFANGFQLFQKPTLSRTQIVFVHAGDLWSVPRDGGEARRLTTAPGTESNPIFSPDGSQIAFTGEYDGNVDVFVVPAAGGVPRRLTYHPAPDFVQGWTPDGKRVLYTSGRSSYSRFARLFTVPLDGGPEEEPVPLPQAFEGTFSPDGSRLAYVPLGRAFNAWKRYRGGLATPVWIATLSSGRVEKVPRDKSNDFNPMWFGDKVYFLSDRNGPVTLFSYDTKSKQVKQEVANDGLDLKSASAGADAIVYEQFGSLHLFDTRSGKSRPVSVRLSGDLAEVRERLVNVGQRLANARISPTGVRAVFEARGEILTVPADKGDPRNLTNTGGVMERDPVWSPDGRSIAYFSDDSGEYQLHIRDQRGTGDVKKISLGETGFYFAPRWSPDSKKVAYVDNNQTIWYVDIEQGKPVKVDKDTYWTFGGNFLAPSWSPDSKWLAYSRRLSNYLAAVFLHSVASGKNTQVTDGMSDARLPVFDKDGKYLYFAASTDLGPAIQPDLHAATRQVTSSLYIAVLAKDQPSPLAAESDEEKPAEEKKPEPPGEAAKEGPTPAAPPARASGAAKAPPARDIKIDFENLDQRILALPMPARRYVSLQAGKAGTLFAVEAPAGGPGGGPPVFSVHRFDLKTRRSDTPLSGVRNFEISFNGEKMLYRQGERWFIRAPRPMPAPGAPAPPSAPPAGGDDGLLKTAGLEVRASPREEWRQMYREVWRVQRDFFYDPNHHGLDLKAAERRYESWLENVTSRSDLNYLFAEMMGELSVGHMGVAGGDTPEVKRVANGLLGADYKIENGRYRFARVYSGENWNPQLKAPLTEPGVNVAAGEYLLAVNGRDLRGTDNIYGFFEATAGKQVVLRVGPDPSGANSREVTVVPVPNDNALRHRAWIDENRRKVDQATKGRVAYVYMPDTSFGGLTNFTRYFFAQVGKEGVIIDERFNGGGMLATDIVEILNRRQLSRVATRTGADEVQPQGAIFGPKVMLVNEFAGSGGDAMPWYFKRTNAGKLIGKRTWGGLVGRAAAPQLMDGGFVSSPSSGVWNPDTSQWEVENIGVSPDIEVEQDPELVRKGQDPQLEKAIQVVMQELEKNPVRQPKRPPYPNFHQKKAAAAPGSAPRPAGR